MLEYSAKEYYLKKYGEIPRGELKLSHFSSHLEGQGLFLPGTRPSHGGGLFLPGTRGQGLFIPGTTGGSLKMVEENCF